MRVLEPFARPLPGTWVNGTEAVGEYKCLTCGRSIYYTSAMSGSAWRHTATRKVCCPRAVQCSPSSRRN